MLPGSFLSMTGIGDPGTGQAKWAASASHLPSGGAASASTGRGRLLSGFGANARSQGIHQINDPVRGRLLGWLNDPAFLLSAEQFHEGGFKMVDELRGVEMDRLAIHNMGRQVLITRRRWAST